MPAKLKVETVRVTWRVEADDYALLEALYPLEVNTFIRALIHAWAERQRARLQGQIDPLDIQSNL